ncbi:MAG: serine/threonine protein kinase, partial [Polyangiaceae bacterium]|nr:serine/threonine protein kinase [Polyangiaceae bacterium]
RPLSGDRYETARTLGAGGMGEVLLCRDLCLGRDVAMKVMRTGVDDGSVGRARFLREARLQGQLEHPSVVPVHDLATGASGAPYFTMKRIQGLTLRAILDRLAEGDPLARQQFGRRKLLSALSQACLAVGFAHKRGVIHRDLKPDNLMLGEFGEVYVLDWGVARTVEVPDEPASDDQPAISKRTPISVADESLPGTVAGALVGTPGYMSPEQARGETDELSPRSDVYSLGCVLFEMLTLKALHDAPDIPSLIVSAITKHAPKPSSVAEAADIAPELDLICARALSLDPADRFASAREMADALERFMDGERDAEVRKTVARAHLSAARGELEAAAAGGEAAEQARARGMRELGRALALDPTSEEAMQLVTRVVMAAPTELPPAAQAELKEVELQDRAANARRATGAYATFLLFVPILAWAGVRSLTMTLVFLGSLAAVAGYSFWMGRTGNVQPRFMRVSIVINFVLTSLLAVVCGPLLLVPNTACLTASLYLVGLRPNRNTRNMIGGLAALAVFVPAVLEWTGVLPPSMAFVNGELRVLPRVSYFPEVPSLVFFSLVALVQIVNVIVFVGGAVDKLLLAERKNFALAYRLGQLLPVKDAGAP